MKTLNQKQNRKFNFSAYIFTLILVGGFQWAEGAVDSTNARSLSQNLTTVEKDIKELHKKIYTLKQKVSPAIYQTQKLERENKKLREVLARSIPTGSTYPWLNLSQPQKFEFTVTSTRAIKDKAVKIKNNIDELVSRHLSSFAEAITDVEEKNKEFRTQYKQAKAQHRQKQIDAKKAQAQRNWEKVTNLAEKISSPENIPKNPMTGKKAKTWKEYWDAKNEYEMMNSR